jgi:hypothetical protein
MTDKALTESVNPLFPVVCDVIKIIDETPDVKTFHVTSKNGKPFTPKPGQLGMVSLLDVGEAMFSVTYQGEDHLEFAIKRVGMLTDALHEIEVGQKLGVRGPYGNGFPIEMMKGKDLLFIGGGIGLAPLRSLINYSVVLSSKVPCSQPSTMVTSCFSSKFLAISLALSIYFIIGHPSTSCLVLEPLFPRLTS